MVSVYAVLSTSDARSIKDRQYPVSLHIALLLTDALRVPWMKWPACWLGCLCSRLRTAATSRRLCRHSVMMLMMMIIVINDFTPPFWVTLFTWELRELRTKFWPDSLKGRDYFQDLVIDGSIILKLNLNKWDVSWIHLAQDSVQWSMLWTRNDQWREIFWSF